MIRWIFALAVISTLGGQPALAAKKVKVIARRPASPYHCKLSSNLRAPAVKDQFDLVAKAERTIFENTKVEITADHDKPKFSIYQYADPKKSTYYLYQYECDFGLNCSGARTEKMGPDASNNVDQFKIEGGSAANGYIGNRQVMQFRTIYHGFSFEFIAYTLEPNTRVGVKLECQD